MLGRVTMRFLAGCALAGTAGAGKLRQCPTQGELINERCTLTQPNFTQWCTAGQEEPEPGTPYYFYTSAGVCARAERLTFDTNLGDPFTAKKCTLCAPFTELEECRRVCEEGFQETTEDESSELFQEFDLSYFLSNVFIALYACYGLALCCEDFFVSSLEILIDRAGMPADVAGATFMAAGSSSPELFVAAVTIFLPKDADVCQANEACIHKDPGLGVGTVIGSTMFNTMCIIGGSAIISGKTTTLDWRIVARDGTSYCVAILTLMYVLMDEICDEGQCMEQFDVNGRTVGAVDMQQWGTVRWYEALGMISVYAGYVTLCWKYSMLTDWLCSKESAGGDDPEVDAWISSLQSPPTTPEAAVAAAAAAGGGGGGGGGGGAQEELRFTVGGGEAAAGESDGSEDERGAEDDEDGGGGHGEGGHGHGNRDESCADTLRHLFDVPGTLQAKFVWLFSLPLLILFSLTIIDCRNKRYENYYPATMGLAICWLGLIVDFMVHAFEAIAQDLHMTESTIGLVFSAAGTSFPDFLASLIVAKKGMADMAVRAPSSALSLSPSLSLSLPP